MPRCCNIDWLEVYLLEEPSIEYNVNYWESYGFNVQTFDYGTPQYKEMYVLSIGTFPIYRILRVPRTRNSNFKILPDNASHIRLYNRQCYAPNCIQVLREFILEHKYTYKGITRIDICNDFNLFDNGMKPSTFVNGYLKHIYRKMGQRNGRAFFKDRWDNFDVNSLSWGSPKSMISVKLYDKTLELEESKEKFYIRDAWNTAGLRSDIHVWRLEFSIKTDAKAFVRTDDGEFLPNKLTTYDTPDKLLFAWFLLYFRYFRFKKQIKNRNGVDERKDRCPDLDLFRTHTDEHNWKPIRETMQHEPNRTQKMFAKELQRIQEDESNELSYRQAATMILQFYEIGNRIPMDQDKVTQLMIDFNLHDKD